MRKIIFLILLLGLVISCSSPEADSPDDITVELDNSNGDINFIEEADEVFLEEGYYVEIGEMV